MRQLNIFQAVVLSLLISAGLFLLVIGFFLLLGDFARWVL